MKRRLLSAFLAVMMVLTMAPVAFAADTSATVSTQDELLTALNDASITEITLTNDIALTGVWTPVEIAQGRTLVINGAGNTISDLEVTGGILAPSGSGVAGDGHSCDYYAAFIGVNKGTLTINNLKFTNADVDIKPVTVSLASTGSSMISVVCANNAGDMVYNDVEVQNCVVRGYTKVGLLNGFTSPAKTGSFVANHCAIVNCEVVVEADGTDPEASLNAAIIGYDGYNHAKTNGIKLQNVTCTIDESVKWADGIQTKEDGTKYCGGWGIYSPTYAHDNYDVKTVPMVAEIDGYQYESLADAIAAAEDGGTIKLLKDVEETLRLKQGEDITLNLNGHTLSAEQTTVGVVHGKLVVNGPGTIKENKPNFGAIIAYGSVSQNDTDYTEVTVNKDVTLEGWAPVFIDQKNGKAYGVSVNLNGVTLNAKNDTSNAVGSGIYVNGQITDAVNSPVINLDSTTIASTGHGMYLAGYATTTVNGGSVSGSETGIEIRAGKLTVNGATVTGNGIPTSVTPNGNGSTSVGAGIAVAQHTTELPIDVTISDGMISGYTGLLESNPQNNPAASIARVNINVAGGKFAAINGGKNAVSSDDKRVIISGGVFAQKFDNSYCATGLTVVSNESAETKTTYPWTVGTVEVKDENVIKTDTKAGATTATLGSEIATENENAAKTVGKSVTPTKLADTTPITPDDKAQALTELVKNNKVELDTNGKIPNDTTVTVVKETYLDVTVTAYDTTNNTVSMDITPKYNLIAVAKTGTDEKKVTLKSAQDAKVGSTEVQVTLPDAFKGKKVYINHNNGANLYVATADEDGKITFTTNGFSPFTFALTNSDVVAEVNGNAYKSLQNAIDAAQTGATIVLQKNCTEKVTVAGKSLTINRNGKTFNEANVTVGSNCTKEVKNDTIVVTYTKPSSGGSSGGSSSGKTTYKVTTSAVNNGGVNASPSNAEKGAVITITLSPDKGYKLDKLTVTDGSGKTVSTVKKSDTVYTFTMPASAVKVGVSYVKATETPSETKFNDVSANDWFASAVDYVTGKGMMNGTADNTFSPKANTTRGMVVTVLYRLENQPSTSAASFTDVASGAYYANAVAWANANGIVSGYGSGKFGPNDKVTREQLAAILYRYAQYKKYDVSVGEDTNILSYDDAQSISSYAIPAIQWACGAGVVTGKSGSKLDPKGNATRAEVAAMLMRFCENVK